MHMLYQSDRDFQQHSKAILSIADQYHLQENLIRQLYEKELTKLQLTARFKNFLSVLVTRHVKESLHNSGVINKH